MNLADVNTASSRDRLYLLVSSVHEGKMSVRDFCQQFETTYNLQLSKEALSEAEMRIFAELFDKVVWYSPFPLERQAIPHYLGEKEIMMAVNRAIANLAART